MWLSLGPAKATTMHGTGWNFMAAKTKKVSKHSSEGNDPTKHTERTGNQNTSFFWWQLDEEYFQTGTSANLFTLSQNTLHQNEAKTLETTDPRHTEEAKTISRRKVRRNARIYIKIKSIQFRVRQETRGLERVRPGGRWTDSVGSSDCWEELCQRVRDLGNNWPNMHTFNTYLIQKLLLTMLDKDAGMKELCI